MDVAESVRSFLVDEGYVDEESLPADDDSLFESGAIDSLAVVELTEFISTTFGIRIKDEDLIPENFDSIGAMARFVASKAEAG